MDLSACTGALVDITLSASSRGGVYSFDNCKLGAGVSLVTGAPSGGPGGPIVELRNSDSGVTNYRHEYHSYMGDMTTETTIVRTSGASDGTTAISWQIDASANTEWGYPFYTPWVTGWNNTSGSSVTWTAQIVHDSVTNLQNDEVWLEVEVLEGDHTQSTISTDRVADILTTAADQSTTGATWTTTGLTNPNTQDCSVSRTPQNIGPWRARLGVNKASKTLYFCPLIDVT